MPRKDTKTVETLQSQSGDAVAVFFPDLSRAQSLTLEAAANTQFPPTAEGATETVGGIWWLSVPAGKSVLMIDTPMSVEEAEDIELVRARAWPITGPIQYPVGFENSDYCYLVPDGVGFDVSIVPNKLNGGA